MTKTSMTRSTLTIGIDLGDRQSHLSTEPGQFFHAYTHDGSLRIGEPFRKARKKCPGSVPLQHVTDKLRGAGCEQLAVTERGSTFGYGRLVVDMTGLRDMTKTGGPLIIDATRAVQRPGEGGRTGGDRSLAPLVARSAFATGLVDGLFCEVHPDPDSSPSDGPNMIRLEEFEGVLRRCLVIHAAANPRD